MREILCCPLCEHDQLDILLRRTVIHPGKDIAKNLGDINFVRNYILFEKILKVSTSCEFKFLICRYCGLIFFTPRPSVLDMEIKYQMMDELRDTEYRDAQRGYPIYDDYRAREIYRLLSYYKKIRSLTVFDVGGANGYNLKHFLMENDGFVVDYGERELYPGAQYLCRTTGEIPDSLLGDVLLCCHTLEHVVDPVMELKEMYKKTADGGLIYLEVPLGCYDEFKYTKNFLTHVNFFSEGSLAYTMQKSGFHIIYLKTRLTTVRWFRWLTITAIGKKKGVSPGLLTEGYHKTRDQMNNHIYKLLRFLGAQWTRFDSLMAESQ